MSVIEETRFDEFFKKACSYERLLANRQASDEVKAQAVEKYQKHLKTCKSMRQILLSTRRDCMVCMDRYEESLSTLASSYTKFHNVYHTAQGRFKNKAIRTNEFREACNTWESNQRETCQAMEGC